MPEDEPGELAFGWLVEEDVAEYEHETVLSFLNAALRGWVVPRGGFVAGSEVEFAVGVDQGRKPDLSVYLAGDGVPPRRGPLGVPPDIAIEVVSPTSIDARRDRIEKAHEYAVCGVRWYWIIDPATRALEVFELGSERRYALVLAAVEGSVVLPGCGDFRIDLDALWAEIGRLGAGG
jgi:Uma2 family endonuclease